jgi:hypothetical protein
MSVAPHELVPDDLNRFDRIGIQYQGGASRAQALERRAVLNGTAVARFAPPPPPPGAGTRWDPEAFRVRNENDHAIEAVLRNVVEATAAAALLARTRSAADVSLDVNFTPRASALAVALRPREARLVFDAPCLDSGREATLTGYHWSHHSYSEPRVSELARAAAAATRLLPPPASPAAYAAFAGAGGGCLAADDPALWAAVSPVDAGASAGAVASLRDSGSVRPQLVQTNNDFSAENLQMVPLRSGGSHGSRAASPSLSTRGGASDDDGAASRLFDGDDDSPPALVSPPYGPPRPTPLALAPPLPRDWVCGACTYKNLSSAAMRCEICDTPC